MKHHIDFLHPFYIMSNRENVSPNIRIFSENYAKSRIRSLWMLSANSVIRNEMLSKLSRLRPRRNMQLIPRLIYETSKIKIK